MLFLCERCKVELFLVMYMKDVKFNDEGYYIQYLDDAVFKNFDEIIRKQFVEIF